MLYINSLETFPFFTNLVGFFQSISELWLISWDISSARMCFLCFLHPWDKGMVGETFLCWSLGESQRTTCINFFPCCKPRIFMGKIGGDFLMSLTKLWNSWMSLTKPWNSLIESFLFLSIFKKILFYYHSILMSLNLVFNNFEFIAISI